MRQLNFLLFGLIFSFFPWSADCQTTAEEPDITASASSTAADFPDYLGSYVDDVETEKNAKSSARDILGHKPEIVSLRQNQIKALEETQKKIQELRNKLEQKALEETALTAAGFVSVDSQTATAEEIASAEKAKQEMLLKKEIEELKQSLNPAPLGLYWNASLEELQKLGFEFKPAQRKDYQNVFMVLNPQQKNNAFRSVTTIFGIQNRLWCIFAQGQFINDDAKASKVLALYHQYYNALAKKYGHAREHFTPYTYEEELISGEGNAQTKTIIQKQNPLGGDNFLQELQEGKAVLYATFENKTIGVTLGVSVDDSGKSYISIDYKELDIMKKEHDATLDEIVVNL